jgi:glycosyltransferase involved in cell wall biosynthesis
MEKQNKFKIITPSYNNAEWVEYNLASILNQTYTNYDVLYINDASTDNTYELVNNLVGDDAKFNIINRTTNCGAMYNYSYELEKFISDDDSIIIHLDGDDWLYDDTVLEQLNEFYNQHDCWMTYGGFIVWNGHDIEPALPYPQSTPFSDFVHEHKLYRLDHWRASHLRTYKSFLYKAIQLDDFKSKINNELYWHAADLAMQFPCLEMCSPDKIGLINFYACVYNHSKANKVRTQERESVDNSKYEIEIRNKKKYKQGLSGETLPQVNVIGDFRERNSIASTFSYVYNLEDGDFDITLIQDGDIIRYINGDIKINRGKVVADIHEAPHLLQQNQVYLAVKENPEKFDRILTYDTDLLKLPNAVFRNGGYEVVLNKNVHSHEYPKLQDDSLQQIYDKTKLISFITSNKTITEGHRFRIECYNRLMNQPNSVDIFGKGIRDIIGKIEGLKDYKFSIAIENGIHDNYFTEKILDCFLTGTIPIYRGPKNIGDFFDINGIITFETVDELINIVNTLTDNEYQNRIKSIENNFGLAKKFSYNNNQIFNNFLKDLI